MTRTPPVNGRMNDPVIATMRGRALWVVLNRPDTLNSLTVELVQHVRRCIERAGSDPSIRALVITGSGRAFCAGGDLVALAEDGGVFRSGAPLFGAISETLSRLEALPIPTIAAVNGLAVAGGLEIVLACDIVVAAHTAEFGDGHAKYGLLPGAGGSVRLPRKIGVNRAKYLMMTGATVSARTMADWGLVTQICPAEDLEVEVDRLTTTLAQNSRDGLAGMKTLIDGGLQMTAERALAEEFRICAEHDRSPDRNEGLAAFAAKRPPRFE